jgi:hypothetical protein
VLVCAKATLAINKKDRVKMIKILFIKIKKLYLYYSNFYKNKKGAAIAVP